MVQVSKYYLPWDSLASEHELSSILAGSVFLATESDKWLHLGRATMMSNKTNIGYGYHSYPSGKCAYCVNSCSPLQSWSGCISWNKELHDCNHGCALTWSCSACEDSSTKLPFVWVQDWRIWCSWGGIRMKIKSPGPGATATTFIIFFRFPCGVKLADGELQFNLQSNWAGADLFPAQIELYIKMSLLNQPPSIFRRSRKLRTLYVAPSWLA